MNTETLKCSHGTSLTEHCSQCDQAKINVMNIYNRLADENKDDKRTPILRGCMASQQGGCFCTGRCNEVIGYVESNGSKTFLKCEHGKLLSGFPCTDCEGQKQASWNLLNNYARQKD